jgi:hypothetical protein
VVIANAWLAIGKELETTRRKGGLRMSRGFSLSIAVILLLSSAGFAAIEQAHGHTMVVPGYTTIVGHGQWVCSYHYCGTVGFQQQTGIVRCHQYQVIHWFHCWPHKPLCKPPSKPQCIAIGGDASATATAVSYDGGSAQATAHAVGGSAIVVNK